MYAQACEKDASSMTIFHTPGHGADVIFSISWGKFGENRTNTNSGLSTLFFHPPASQWWPFSSVGLYAVRRHGNEIFLPGVISTGN